MNKSPLVTIGTLSYNTGKYVVKTLESIKGQNYHNFEHIIIDDCSTDNSIDLIDKWINENDYQCIFIKRTKNQGYHSGLNEIINMANGDYICFVSDDIWHPNKTRLLVDALEQNGSGYAVAYGDHNTIDESGNIIEKERLSKYYSTFDKWPQDNIFINTIKDFSYYGCLQFSLIRLKAIKDINFKFESQFIQEDWHFALEMSRKFKYVGVNEIVGEYLVRKNSLSNELFKNENYLNFIRSNFNLLMHYYDTKSHKSVRNAIVNKLSSLTKKSIELEKNKINRLKFIYKQNKVKMSPLFSIKMIIKYILKSN